MSHLQVSVRDKHGNTMTKMFTSFTMSTSLSCDSSTDSMVNKWTFTIEGYTDTSSKEKDAVEALMMFSKASKVLYVCSKSNEMPDELMELMKEHLQESPDSALRFFVKDEQLDMRSGTSFRMPMQYRNPPILGSTRGQGGYADILQRLGFKRRDRSLALGCYHDWHIPNDLDVQYLRCLIWNILDTQQDDVVMESVN